MFGIKFTKYFLTAGKSTARTELNAFDQALLNSLVGNTNLVKLSSILPPGATEIEPFHPPKGCFLPVAYAHKKAGIEVFKKQIAIPDATTQWLSSAVAVAIPIEEEENGLIMELSGFFSDDAACEIEVKRMVLEGMAYRKIAVKEVKSISANLSLWLAPIGCASTFAAVVLIP